MGYKTLYRKYRSRTFAEVVDQSHVIRVLKGSLARERIAHAYLFSGPRGTGKTSVARIFAKALNCPQLSAGDPCGKCEVCTSIAEGRSPDVIEMDAASNRGVESIEELRRGVQFVPQALKYKVYIIDEVHMITTHGFNALLKTLEEPPSHIIFILATTAPQALPITILSRCLRFEFRRLPYDELSDHLKKVADYEGAVLNDEAAVLLSELSEGSARDAISLLEQLIIAGGEEITPELIRELFGLSHPKAVTDLVGELVGGRIPELLTRFRAAIASGRDPEHFLKLFYEKLRDGYLRTGDDDELLVLLESVERERLLLCIEAIWDALGLLRRSNHPVGLVEITLFKLSAILSGDTRPAPIPALDDDYAEDEWEEPEPDVERPPDTPEAPRKPADPKKLLEAVKEKTEGLEERLIASTAPREETSEEPGEIEEEVPQAETQPDARIAEEKEMPKPRRTKLPEGLDPFSEEMWSKFLAALKAAYLTTYCLIHPDSGVVPVLLREGFLYLAFPTGSGLERGFCREGRHKRAIEAIMKEVTGEGFEVVFNPSEARAPDSSDDEIAAVSAAQLELLLGNSDTER